MLGQLSSAYDQLWINAAYKDVVVRQHRDPLTVQSSGVNLALSFPGLNVLGADGLETFPQEFSSGMAARATTLGDVDDSAPAQWTVPFANGTQVHAMVIVAADALNDLQQRSDTVKQLAQSSGVTLTGEQPGDVRPNPTTGHEHFGFKDGISQPGIAGLTKSSKDDEPVAAGEFLIGYPDETGAISGAASNPVAPTPGQPGYGQPTPPPTPGLPPWTRNGSFLVYRRLRQNVQGFQAFLASEAPPLPLSVDQLGVKLVGRWASGAPLEQIPGQPTTPDPSTVDPSIANPHVLLDQQINNFGYAADPDGQAVPRAAHIRKAYPRDQATPGEKEADRHRILRRGIPYGSEFTPGEPAYGQVVPDTQDRGLLFLCYQASILRGFEFIQTVWANVPAFPQAGDGNDPIISQNNASGSFNLPPHPTPLTLERWVTTTGGDYFFAPSISAIEHLAGTS
jgi:Dyp-type peroxidase family